VIDEGTRAVMQELLAEVRSGEFAREWILENQAGRPVYNALKRQGEAHLIEKVGKELRSMMAWLKH
jgi:ketol-acid reductoisomerase